MKFFILFVVIYTSTLFSQEKTTVKLTLEEAIKIALMKSDEKKIAKINYDIAQSKYNQALSANYPKLDLEFNILRRDENMNINLINKLPSSFNKMLFFVFSLEKTNNIVQAGKMANNVKDNVSFDYSMEQDLSGRDLGIFDFNLTYPLYTGGKISSIIKQAKINTKLVKSDIRLAKSDIVFGIKKLYYTYILTRNIYISTLNSLEQMYLIKDLTQKLYMGESLNVNKTDYLKTKMAVHFIEAKLQDIKSNLNTIQLTLASILEMPDKNVGFSDTKFNLNKIHNNIDFNILIESLKTNNINMKKMNLQLDISKELIKESKANYLPKVLFYANTQKQYNSLDYGHNTEQNKKSWTIGLLAKMNLFSGFKHTNTLLEKRLYKKKLETYSKIISKTNILQIKQLFNQQKINYKNIITYKKISKIAKENLTLSLKAYRIDMIKTRDLLEAQLYKSKATIIYYKAIHKYFFTNIQIERVLNKELM